jgi:hypothetical protein
MSNKTMTPEEIAQALAAPFALDEVHFKPTAVSGNRALAVAFVDARAIQERLDAVVGVANWKDKYTPQPDGTVLCRLSIRIDGEWITKSDAGGPADMQDAGDRLKSATSDSLKRAAVKWSIGRYLYRLPATWCDWDAKKKQFTSKPSLPAWALPHSSARPAHAADANSTPPAKGNALPKDGRELEIRLAAFEAKLVAQDLCEDGDLCRHVLKALIAAGHGSEVEKWGKAAIEQAVQEVKDFEQRAREKQARKESTRQRISTKA